MRAKPSLTNLIAFICCVILLTTGFNIETHKKYPENKQTSTDFYLTSGLRYSDLNLKENINNVGNCLDKIKQLRPVTYNYKSPEYSVPLEAMDTLSYQSGLPIEDIKQQFKIEGKPRLEIGFIAQEVQMVFPEVVNTSTEGNLYIDYVALIPLLIKAIQEQQQKIDQLEKTVNSLATN